MAADPRADNVGYFFDRAARETPDREAIIDLWGGVERHLTYRDLYRRVDRAAALLGALDLAPGDRVALLIGNRVEFLECFLGAMRIGLVPAPLNPRQAPAALDYMIRDCGAVAAIVDESASADGIALCEAAGLRARIALGENPPPGWISYASADAAGPVRPALSPDGIAFQPYTAGSTGRPKGVRLPSKGIAWSIIHGQLHWPVAADAVGLVAVPLFHKNAMRGAIKPALCAGAKVVIMPNFDPRAFLTALAKYRVTFCGGVPAIFIMALQHQDLIGTLDFSALRSVTIGSAVVPVELIRGVERAFPQAKVYEVYGLTDAGGPLRTPILGGALPRGSCGTRTPGYEVKLVGPDGTERQDQGELWTRNPCVTEGYHNLPELSRERIVDGWLRTGDLFRVDADGFFYFQGRTDDMFSCGGENIYPREVEELLLSHPDIIDACVVPLPHAVKGLVPGALVVPRPGVTIQPEKVRAFTLSRGPAYAHPRVIVAAGAVPLSGAGKPDRAEVRARLLAAATD